MLKDDFLPTMVSPDFLKEAVRHPQVIDFGLTFFVHSPIVPGSPPGMLRTIWPCSVCATTTVATVGRPYGIVTMKCASIKRQVNSFGRTAHRAEESLTTAAVNSFSASSMPTSASADPQVVGFFHPMKPATNLRAKRRPNLGFLLVTSTR